MKRELHAWAGSILLAITTTVVLVAVSGCDSLDAVSGSNKLDDTTKIDTSKTDTSKTDTSKTDTSKTDTSKTDTTIIATVDTIPADSLAGTLTLTKTDRHYFLKGSDITGSITIGRNVSVVVLGRVEVSGSLTIQEGATLKFEENAYLEVSTGKLTVAGSDSLPVLFTTRVAGKYWGYGSTEDYSGGIWFSTGANPTSSIRYAHVEYAKSGIYTAVDGIAITRSTFKNSKFVGVHFAANSVGPDLGFANNHFVGNKVAPLRMYASQLYRLDGTQSFDAGEKPIYVKGAAVTETGSWKPLSVPYQIEGIANVENSSGVVLTILAGTNIIYNQNAYLEIGNSGTVKVTGTAALPVTMKPAETGKRWGYGSTKDYSGGIWISPDASANTSFSHLILDSASTGIYVGVSGIAIDNSTFSGTEFQAIYFANDIVPGSLSGNTFANTGLYAFSLPVEGLGVLTNNCSFSGTGSQIRVLDGDLKLSGTVKNFPVPYLVTGKLGIANPDQEVVMTVEPGTHFKFVQNQWCELGDNGTLIAQGTAAKPIIMEAAVSGTTWGYGTYPDYCGGVWFETGATINSKLSHITFRGVINNVPYFIQNKLPAGNITNITVE